MPTFEARFLWLEVQQLAEECAWTDPMFGLIVRFTALTGLRAAEVAGLNVGDVKILGNEGTITVRQTRTLTRVGLGHRTAQNTPVPARGSARSTRKRWSPTSRRTSQRTLAWGEADAPLFYGRNRARTSWTRHDFDPSTFYRRVFGVVRERARLGRSGITIFAIPGRLDHGLRRVRHVRGVAVARSPLARDH